MAKFFEKVKEFCVKAYTAVKNVVVKIATVIGKDGWEDVKDHALIFVALVAVLSLMFKAFPAVGLSLIGSALAFVLKNKKSEMSVRKQAFSWLAGLIMGIILVILL